MSDEDRERDGPIGLEALSEMGRRLLDVVGSVEQTFKREQTSRSHSFTIATPRGRLKGNVGFTIRHGIAPEKPDRAPARRQAPLPQPKIDSSDAGLIDVFDEPAEVIVTLAPCAIGLHELAVRIEGAELHIEANSASRFRKRVALPHDVGHALPAVRLSNGILEIRIPKPTTTPVPPPSS